MRRITAPCAMALAMTFATPSLAFVGSMQPLRADRILIPTTFLDRDDFRSPYRDELFALRSLQAGACGFGREWYPFPTRRSGGYFVSPGPCGYGIYRIHRKRYR